MGSHQESIPTVESFPPPPPLTPLQTAATASDCSYECTTLKSEDHVLMTPPPTCPPAPMRRRPLTARRKLFVGSTCDNYDDVLLTPTACRTAPKKPRLAVRRNLVGSVTRVRRALRFTNTRDDQDLIMESLFLALPNYVRQPRPVEEEP